MQASLGWQGCQACGDFCSFARSFRAGGRVRLLRRLTCWAVMAHVAPGCRVGLLWHLRARRTCQAVAEADMLGCRGTCRARMSCRSAVAPPGQTVVPGDCRTSLLWRCCGLLRPVVITATSLPATRKTASLPSRLPSLSNSSAANSNRKQHSVKAGCDHRVSPRQPTTESCSPAKQTAPTPKATWPATELGICATQAKVAP